MTATTPRHTLVTAAPPRDREVEAAKAKSPGRQTIRNRLKAACLRREKDAP